MDPGNELLKVPSSTDAERKRVQMAGDPLLAAGDPQQFPVTLGRPAPVEPECAECLIEGTPMHVLGVRQRTVDIENQRFQTHLRSAVSGRTRFSLRHSMSRQIIGVKMSCMARSIFPPGHTIVLGRDMNESCSIDSR